MKKVIHWALRFFIILFAILHFITIFYENTILLHVLAISAFGMMLFTILKQSISKIKLPFTLFLLGVIILLVSDTSLINGLYNGLLQMRNMVGLLIIVPMISWVLREETYVDSIMGFAHHLLDTSKKFYFGMAAFTQVIAYFLLFGSISMMYQFVNMVLKEEKGEVWEHFKGTALLRGFALSVMWVVSIPSFAFVVEIMDASLGKSIVQGLVISTIGIFLAVLFSHVEEKRYGVDITAGLEREIDDIMKHTTDRQKMIQNVVEFIVLFITLFGSILILHAYISLELLVLIPLVVLVWILLYYLLKGRPKKLLKEAKTYVQQDISKQSYQLCVMLGAGMMIFALNQTGFAPFVVNGIYAVQETTPFLNILFFLPFIVILLGFVGLGPLTVMVLVGGILETIHLPYPPELIVLAVTSGSAISILLSPLIMPVIMLSGMNGMSGFKNGIQFNWKYAVAIYVVTQIWVQFWVNIG